MVYISFVWGFRVRFGLFLPFRFVFFCQRANEFHLYRPSSVVVKRETMSLLDDDRLGVEDQQEKLSKDGVEKTPKLSKTNRDQKQKLQGTQPKQLRKRIDLNNLNSTTKARTMKKHV